MINLKRKDFEAYEYLKAKGPNTWSMTHYSSKTVCDTQCNNHCESFNKVLKKARAQPLLSLLETIRKYLRDRFARKKEEVTKWSYNIRYQIQKIYRVNLDEIMKCQAIYIGENLFKVSVGCNGR